MVEVDVDFVFLTDNIKIGGAKLQGKFYVDKDDNFFYFTKKIEYPQYKFYPDDPIRADREYWLASKQYNLEGYYNIKKRDNAIYIHKKIPTGATIFDQDRNRQLIEDYMVAGEVPQHQINFNVSAAAIAGAMGGARRSRHSRRRKTRTRRRR